MVISYRKVQFSKTLVAMHSTERTSRANLVEMETLNATMERNSTTAIDQQIRNAALADWSGLLFSLVCQVVPMHQWK